MSDDDMKPGGWIPAEREIGARWIVMRRANGHFESIGPLTESFTSEADAYAKAEELLAQHRGQRFAVFKLSREYVYEPVMVHGVVREP